MNQTFNHQDGSGLDVQSSLILPDTNEHRLSNDNYTMRLNTSKNLNLNGKKTQNADLNLGENDLRTKKSNSVEHYIRGAKSHENQNRSCKFLPSGELQHPGQNMTIDEKFNSIVH